MFISIDGGDGSGKSTQISLLKDYFEKQGKSVIVCREPGSTRLGEAVRNILLNQNEIQIDAKSETFLFMAARSQLVREIIQPAIQSSKIVLCDRFLLSTFAYQGYAVQQSIDELWTLGQIAVGSCYPDLTFLLDIDPEIAFRRIERSFDRMESKGIDFHRRVREGFLKAAEKWNQQFPRRCFIIDSSVPFQVVAQNILNVVESFLQ